MIAWTSLAVLVVDTEYPDFEITAAFHVFTELSGTMDMSDLLQDCPPPNTLYYIVYAIYYKLYTTYYILYTIYYILYTMYYILNPIYYILHTTYYTLCTIYYTL